MANEAPRLRRVATMVEQMDQTADEYTKARDQFDQARIRYEVASDKFASVRRFAMNVLSSQDWYRWRSSHPGVQYTGLKIGEAITEALENYAYSAATAFWTAKAKDENPNFFPVMTLERIQETLEHGGFEFRTATPLREVNAALINSATVVKHKTHSNLYQLARADEILKEMDFVLEFERERLATAKAKAEEAKKADDDDVPF